MDEDETTALERTKQLVIGHFDGFVNRRDLGAIDRNLWTGTRADTGGRVEFHGFVLWRVVDGKIVERWATVTPMHELVARTLNW